MQTIDFNELPRWTPWPDRLLGNVPWDIPERGLEKVQAEYDAGKYAQCLQYFQETDGEVTPDDVRRFQMEQGPDETICVSLPGKLALMPFEEARGRFHRLVADTLRPALENNPTVVELGCGFGYNLWVLSQSFPGYNFLGGEYAANAVRLADGLYRDIPQIQISPFNFYDHTYDILEQASGPLVIFTAFAIEQLPSAQKFFDALGRHREKIEAVFHFEPVYELFDKTTLLGLMCRRYVECNDYNRDLRSQLQQRSQDIHVLKTDANVLGINPLFPISTIHWEYRP